MYVKFIIFDGYILIESQTKNAVLKLPKLRPKLYQIYPNRVQICIVVDLYAYTS